MLTDELTPNTTTVLKEGGVDMPLPIDIEIPAKPGPGIHKCFYEEYEGRQKDLADELYRIHYWILRAEADQNYERVKAATLEKGKPFAQLPPEQDKEVLAAIQADAHLLATKEAYTLRDGAEQAGGILMYRTRLKQYYKLSRHEYRSLGDWLSNMIPQLAENSSERADAEYLNNVLIPTLEGFQNGTLAKLEAMKDSFPRARAAVPFLRDHSQRLVETETKFDHNIKKVERELRKLELRLPLVPPEQKNDYIWKMQEKVLQQEEEERKKRCAVEELTLKFKDAFNKAIDVIQNPEVPTNGPNGIRKVLARPDANVTIFEGHTCYVTDPNDPENFKLAVQIVLPKEYETALHSVLKHFIELKATDGRKMVAELGKLVMPKGGNKSKKKRR